MNEEKGERIEALWLGRQAYRPTWDLQRAIQGDLIRAKRTPGAPVPPHVLLLVEHPPVYTLGKSGDLAHLLLTEEQLAAAGAEFVQIDRGGDITFHGPGQLVLYPIFDLDRIYTDIHRYLRTLEEVAVRLCTDLGLEAGRVAGRTGVWIEPGRRDERKVAAIGIKCSRWVTSHGMAINVATDLRFFDRIVPCGIRDRGVTSLAVELGRPLDAASFVDPVIRLMGELFDRPVQLLSRSETDRALAGRQTTAAAD